MKLVTKITWSSLFPSIIPPHIWKFRDPWKHNLKNIRRQVFGCKSLFKVRLAFKTDLIIHPNF